MPSIPGDLQFPTGLLLLFLIHIMYTVRLYLKDGIEEHFLGIYENNEGGNAAQNL